MNKEKYKQDLEDIRSMMNRSSRFLSLSGLSGVAAGIIALLGAAAAYFWVYMDAGLSEYNGVIMDRGQLLRLLLIAVLTLALAIVFGVYFTLRETKKRQLKAWDYQSKRLLLNLSIPLVAGGLVCLTMMWNGNYRMVPALSLIFYGLALINASKFTLREIFSLGLLEIILGLIALQIPGYGLLFWIIGFGVLHIVYGMIIPYKQAV
jgi:hypothetical protein